MVYLLFLLGLISAKSGGKGSLFIFWTI
ncbi:uncharacterized protein METZ01_LOCUS516798 [marine metagenome]|uniref:Uncharacterized protein n=1 Tax=marine metagenome TaxID=408172 RepID=A0A383F4Y3_9ZZZZ